MRTKNKFGILSSKFLVLFASILTLSNGAFACDGGSSVPNTKPDKDGILRAPNGMIETMTQNVASRACAAINMRLPTIRDRINFISRPCDKNPFPCGFNGILKNKNGTDVTRQQVESGSYKLPHGYYLINYAIDPKKYDAMKEFEDQDPSNIDSFYYGIWLSRDYRNVAPKNLPKDLFWTSSNPPHFSSYVYDLYGNIGIGMVGMCGGAYAVQCVK
jgi:hypothetical protein